MRWRVKLDKSCDIQVKVVEIKSTGVFNPTEAAKSKMAKCSKEGRESCPPKLTFSKGKPSKFV